MTQKDLIQPEAETASAVPSGAMSGLLPPAAIVVDPTDRRTLLELLVLVIRG